MQGVIAYVSSLEGIKVSFFFFQNQNLPGWTDLLTRGSRVCPGLAARFGFPVSLSHCQLVEEVTQAPQQLQASGKPEKPGRSTGS